MRSLAGGEVGDALEPRPDLTKRATGVRRMRNFFVTKTGGAANRPGWEYLGTLKTNSALTRCVEFIFNKDQAVVLEFGDHYIRFWQSGALTTVASPPGPIWSSASIDYVPGDIRSYNPTGDIYYCIATHTSAAGSSPISAGADEFFWYALEMISVDTAYMEVPTPYGEDELEALAFSQAGDIVTITHVDHPPHNLTRLAPASSNLSWTLLPISVGPAMPAPVNVVLAGGSGPGGFALRYSVSAKRRTSLEESVLGGAGSATGSGVAVDDPADGDDLNVNSTGHGLETGDVIYVDNVVCQAALETNENAVIALSAKTFTVTVSGLDDFTLDGTAGLLTLPVLAAAFPSIELDWRVAYVERLNSDLPVGSGATAVTITWDPVEEVEEYLIYRSINGGDYGLLGATKLEEWVDNGDDEAGNNFAREADQSFQPKVYKNPFVSGEWPRASGFFGQRQVFAGTENKHQSFSLSRTGDFKDFSIHSPLQDDDPFTKTIAARQGDRILHLIDLGQLILFSDGGIWNANPDVNNLVTPAGTGVTPVSYEGASTLQPLVVDDSVLYSEVLESAIREFRYDAGQGGVQGYSGRELSAFAPHLFDGYAIDQWAFARVPHSLVWAKRSDGRMVGLTFVPSQEIWAWHQHDTGDGDDSFQSLCAIPENRVNVVYAIVKRLVDGVEVRYMERLGARRVGHADVDPRLASVFLDSYLTYDGTNTDTGLALELTGGSTWIEGEAGLTLTATGGTPFPNDTTNVGNGYRLRVMAIDDDATSETYQRYVEREVEVLVTAEVSTTVQTVTLLTDAPVETQAAATADWVAMVDEISGLDHLEGRTVGVCADLNSLDQAVVTAGAIPAFARPYGIIHVGLPIRAEFETLAVDRINEGDAVADKRKKDSAVTLWLRNSKGVQAGRPGSAVLGSYRAEADDPANGLVTRMAHIRYAGRWTNTARLLVRQDLPLPAEVLGLVEHVTLGGVS